MKPQEDVHILPHKPCFGSMGPLRFQLNILQPGLAVWELGFGDANRV